MSPGCGKAAAGAGSSEGDAGVVLLGVRFDRLSRFAALAALEGMFGRGEARKVYIVNAHTLNLAWSDPAYRSVLNRADLLLNDGSGVQLASWLAGRPFPDNLVGTDLTPQLCQRAAARGVGIFLLGGLPGVAEAAAERLRSMIPGVRISGVQHGFFRPDEEPRVRETVNSSRAGILLVAFGNPLQETWIHRNAEHLRCDVCIGVGGLVDHWGGRLRRAPQWVRRARMEWIHIMMHQPHKWQRYILGNPLFVARALRAKLGWGP